MGEKGQNRWEGQEYRKGSSGRREVGGKEGGRGLSLIHI